MYYTIKQKKECYGTYEATIDFTSRDKSEFERLLVNIEELLQTKNIEIPLNEIQGIVIDPFVFDSVDKELGKAIVSELEIDDVEGSKCEITEVIVDLNTCQYLQHTDKVEAYNKLKAVPGITRINWTY